MKYFITLTCAILISCGGGGSVSASNLDTNNQATSSSINFSGTGGDFQAAQPIDID